MLSGQRTLAVHTLACSSVPGCGQEQAGCLGGGLGPTEAAFVPAVLQLGPEKDGEAQPGAGVCSVSGNGTGQH